MRSYLPHPLFIIYCFCRFLEGAKRKGNEGGKRKCGNFVENLVKTYCEWSELFNFLCALGGVLAHTNILEISSKWERGRGVGRKRREKFTFLHEMCSAWLDLGKVRDSVSKRKRPPRRISETKVELQDPAPPKSQHTVREHPSPPTQAAPHPQDDHDPPPQGPPLPPNQQQPTSTSGPFVPLLPLPSSNGDSAPQLSARIFPENPFGITQIFREAAATARAARHEFTAQRDQFPIPQRSFDPHTLLQHRPAAGELLRCAASVVAHPDALDVFLRQYADSYPTFRHSSLARSEAACPPSTAGALVPSQGPRAHRFVAEVDSTVPELPHQSIFVCGTNAQECPPA